MKFTLLIATAAALQISKSGSGDGPDCGDIADQVFDHCDKNGDDNLSWKEAKACGAPDDFKMVIEVNEKGEEFLNTFKIWLLRTTRSIGFRFLWKRRSALQFSLDKGKHAQHLHQNL